MADLSQGAAGTGLPRTGTRPLAGRRSRGACSRPRLRSARRQHRRRRKPGHR